MTFVITTAEEESKLKGGERVFGAPVGSRAIGEYEEIEPEEYYQLCEQLHDLGTSLLENPIRDWELSTRARNVLHVNLFNTLYDLRQIPVERILRLGQCGLTTISEIAKEGMNRGHNLANWYQAMQKIQHYKYGVNRTRYKKERRLKKKEE